MQSYFHVVTLLCCYLIRCVVAATPSSSHLRPVSKVNLTDVPVSHVQQTSVRDTPYIIAHRLSSGDAGKAKAEKPTQMDMINQFRAEVCGDMKDEHGKNFETYQECADFMEKACHPGKDMTMDGDGKEVTTGEGFCQEYFKAKKKDEDEDKKRKGVSPAAPAPAPGGGPGPAPAPAPAKSAPAPVAAAPAPTPVHAPAPAPGPVPAPFVPGVTAGKPPVVTNDTAWYYKKHGKDIGRLHMDGNMKLPTQGYWGKLVEHEDQKTVTSDWGKEFGPGQKSIREICKKHPESSWCAQFRRSSASQLSSGLVALVMPLAVLGLVMA